MSWFFFVFPQKICDFSVSSAESFRLNTFNIPHTSLLHASIPKLQVKILGIFPRIERYGIGNIHFIADIKYGAFASSWLPAQGFFEVVRLFAAK